jgi:vitamin B12 transporter
MSVRTGSPPARGRQICFWLAIGIVFVGGCGGAFAQNAPLPELVVSADQVPLEAQKVGASVTVLKGEELRAKGYETVPEALRMVPGVSVTQSGGRGTVTEVRIRGAENNHLMVIIDGIEVNSVGDGGFDFADLPVDDIDRIEVLRGPQSGLYGANAHAGVISIVTLSGKGLLRPVVEAKLEGGSFNTRKSVFSFRGSGGPAYAALTFSDYTSKGYNISRFGSERDGSRSTTVSAKAGVDVTPNLNVEGVFRLTDRAVNTDPQDFNCVFDPMTFTCPPVNPTTYGLVVDGNDRTTFKSTAGRFGATYTLFDGAWVQSANVKRYDDRLRGYSEGFLLFGADGTRMMYDYKSVFRANTAALGGMGHTLSILVDNRQDNYLSVTDGLQYKKERTGLAGEYILDLLATHTTISTALRHDWNTGFADVTTWRVAVSQRFPGFGTRFHASAGKGVTDPTVSELFGSTFNLPNPGLVSESSIGWDAGIEQTFAGGRFVGDVTYFSAEFQDKIELTFDLARGGFVYVNGNGVASRRGVETTGTFKVAEWLWLTGTYTYTDAKNSLGAPEVRRPPHSASFEATARFLDNRGKATLGIVYNGTRKDFFFQAAGTSVVDLPGATVVRGFVSYDVTPWSTVFVRAENLFNVQYEEILSYRMPGFAAYAGVKVRLN